MVECTMGMFWNPNDLLRRQISSIPVYLLLLSEKAKAIFVTKYTNKIQVSDVTRVIAGAVRAQYESVCMTTVMLNLSTHPTA